MELDGTIFPERRRGDPLTAGMPRVPVLVRSTPNREADEDGIIEFRGA
jgi:hypothetical protein